MSYFKVIRNVTKTMHGVEAVASSIKTFIYYYFMKRDVPYDR